MATLGLVRGQAVLRLRPRTGDGATSLTVPDRPLSRPDRTATVRDR